MPLRPTALIVALVLATNLPAQSVPSPASFDWVASGGGLRSDKVRGLTVGPDGSVYIAGESFGEVTFGKEVVAGLGDYDTFLTKLSPQGVPQWTRLSGGPKTDRAYGVAVGRGGDVYVTGHFQGETARFGDVEVKGNGDYDAYLACYSAEGAVRWVRTLGGKGYDYGHGVAVDPSGDVVIAGALVGEADIGGRKVDAGKSAGLFCAKYSPDGEVRLVRVSKGLSGASAHGVAVDGQGRIVIAGLVRGAGEFAGRAISAPQGTSAFVAKLSPEGEALWTAVHPGAPSNLFHEVTCDPQGRVWAVGMYKGRAEVGKDVHRSSKPEDSDGIVCHYSAEGELQWSRTLNGPAVDYVLGVATDGSGACYVTGESGAESVAFGRPFLSRGSVDIFVAKLSPKGDLAWINQAGGLLGDNAYVAACDARGGLYVAGAFGGTAHFGAIAAVAPGSGNEAHVARIDLRRTESQARLPRDQLLLRRVDGGIQPVKDASQWNDRRSEILRGMQSVMGALPNPPRRSPLDLKVEKEDDMGSYVRRRITYVASGNARVPAYLCIPKAALVKDAPRAPAVICLHPTDDKVGVGVVVGLGGKANRQYAGELAERGFVTLSPAYPLLASYQQQPASLGHAGGTVMAVWNHMRGLDLLDSLPYVKTGAYGAIGHSLGGHNAVYLAAFDPRVKTVVSSCGLDQYVDYYDARPDVWKFGKGWCQTRYMPRMAEYAGRLEDIPFDFSEVVATLAPRSVLIVAPLRDSNFRWRSVDKVAAAARPVYALFGAEEALQVEHPDCEHDFPDAMRERAYRLLERDLR